MSQKPDQAMLKTLRQAREAYIDKARAAVKRDNALIKQIKAHIEKQPGTVPEIAEQTRIPANQVLYYIATLKKYGAVTEGDPNGDYFTYQLAEKA